MQKHNLATPALKHSHNRPQQTIPPKRKQSFIQPPEPEKTEEEIYYNPLVSSEEPKKKSKRTSYIRPPDPECQARSLKNFRHIEKIGHGQFGYVVRVIHKYTGLTFALKKITLKSSSQTSKKISLREPQFMGALLQLGPCPYIVRFCDVWFEDSVMVIQMEDCGGGNVYDKWMQNDMDLSEDEIWKLLEHITKALEFMHENNLAHLDIKPENILINKKGDFKICDFGRASLIDCEERHIFNEVLEGDRRYLAMEVLQDNYDDLAGADIFSLGISVYELLSMEELPHNGIEWTLLRNGGYNRDIKNPARFEPIIRQMLCSDSSERCTASKLNEILSAGIQ